MPLLGRSVFITNGAEWLAQRRIIDPAFEGGRLRDTFPAMQAAAEDFVRRLSDQHGQILEIEQLTSHAAADVIFRALFSLPIAHRTAAQVFSAFRAYQRAQPLLNPAAFVPLPRWMPRFHRPRARRAASEIRGAIAALVANRTAELGRGSAPDDLATKIMTMRDPETGKGFSVAEMVDQVAIFFLAGHETSASALAWALYLLAANPEIQERAAAEAATLPQNYGFSDVTRLSFVRDVFRETLRLYPPVPMMVRESRCPVQMRGRDVPKGAQVVLSPWHMHRHERLWERPDSFDPDRWQTPKGQQSARDAYLPFSAGPRACPGAGFAMTEGVTMLAHLLRAFWFEISPESPPVPVAHLTVRARDGIWLKVTRRP